MTITLLIASACMPGCHGKSSLPPSSPEIKSPAGRKGDAGTNSPGSYTWSPAEKKRFMDDCIGGAEGEDVPASHLEDFCNCVLVQSQRYYPHYSRMEVDSVGDHDAEILDACMGLYTKDP